MTERIVERRTMLALTAGGAGVVLTGCVVQAPPAAQPATQPTTRPTTQPVAPPSSVPASEAASQPASQPTDPPLAKLDEVPVGGGVVLADQKLVVTRDAAGKAAAFTAVCTHSGCIVQNVANGTINCGCHGSKFDAATGAVVNGPAAQPLAGLPVVQRDGAIFRA